MISKENQALLEDLGKNNFGRALIALIEDELATLNKEKYTEIEKYWAREMTEEKLNKIFSFLKRSNPQVDKSKTSYA